MKRFFAVGIVLAMVLTAVPFTAVAEAPAEVWVGDESQENNYETIQEAVDAVAEGGIVIVTPGTYTESVTISVPNITLRSSAGRDVTIVDGNGGQVTIMVLKDLGSVTVQGFTVKGWTVAGIAQGVGNSEGTAFNVLDNKVIAPEETSTHGNSIQVTGDGSTVIGNEVTGTHQTSPNWSGSGILVSKANDVTIKNNKVYGGDLGIAVQGGTTYGWEDADCNGIVIENNTVQTCVTGISIQGDAFDTIIKGNVVKGNQIGIGAQSLKDAPLPEGTKAFNNIIVGNDIGAKVSTKDAVDIPSLDAARNWWESADEPMDKVEGEVLFSPWALNKEFTAFADRKNVDDATDPIGLDEDVNYINVEADSLGEDDVLIIVTDEMGMEFPAALLPSGDVEMVISKKEAGTAPAGFKFLGSVFNFVMTADEDPVTEFAGKVTIVFTYDPAEVENPENLDVYWFDADAGEWVPQEGVVDEENNTVTIEVGHWSEFGLMEAEDDDQDPTDPGDPEDPEEPGTGNDEGEEPEDELPKTGANIMWYLPLGMILLLAGALILRRRVTA